MGIEGYYFFKKTVLDPKSRENDKELLQAGARFGTEAEIEKPFGETNEGNREWFEGSEKVVKNKPGTTFEIAWRESTNVSACSGFVFHLFFPIRNVRVVRQGSGLLMW